MKTVKLSPEQKKEAKNSSLISDIVKRGTITEKEIHLITRRMNNGEKIDIQEIWDNPVKCEQSQAEKGLNWLNNLRKSPAGRERKNNPYGYREEDILDNFSFFEFCGVYDCARYGQRSYYLPLYNCCGNDNSFQYYVSGGEINIIG